MSKYTGGRIIPRHDGEWDSTKEYEQLTIVLSSGDGVSYMSRKKVPAGTELSDTDYWVVCSQFSQQLKNVADQAEETDSKVETLKAQVAANVSASTDSDSDYAAEVVDARIGSDGTQYESLGTAVRGQADQLKEMISEVNEELLAHEELLLHTTSNLINPKLTYKGKQVNIKSSGSAYSIAASETFNLNYFIQAEENTEYLFKCFDFDDYTTGYRVLVYCLDSDYSYIGNADTSTKNATNFSSNKCKTFTTLDGTAFVILQYYSSLDSYEQLWFGKTEEYSGEYEPYKEETYAKKTETEEAIKEAVANAYAELNDARTGYDGTEYSSVGEAVREQFGDCRSLIDGINGTLYKETENLFGSAAVYEGVWLTYTSSTGKLSFYKDSDTWSTSYYIDIGVTLTEDTKYYFKCYDFDDYAAGYRVIAYCFDEEYNCIGQSSTTATVFSENLCKVLTLVSGTRYIALQYWSVLNDYSQISFVSASDYTGIYKDHIVLSFAVAEDLSALEDSVNETIKSTTGMLYTKTENLFGSAEIYDGVWLTYTSSTGKIVFYAGSETWSTSYYISLGKTLEEDSVYYFKCYDFDDYDTGYRILVYCFDDDGVCLGLVSASAASFDSEKRKKLTLLAGTSSIAIQFPRTLREYSQLSFVAAEDYTGVYRANYDLIVATYDDLEALSESVNAAIEEMGQETVISENTYNSDTYSGLWLNVHNYCGDVLACYLNSLQFDKTATKYRNKIGRYYSHDSQMIISDDGIAYIAYLENATDLGDNPGSQYAYVELCILDVNDLTTETERTYVDIAAYGTELADGDVLISGAGVPNLVFLDDDTIRITFSSKCESDTTYYLLYCDYSISSGTVGGIHKCSFAVDGVTYDFNSANVKAYLAESASKGAFISVNGTLSKGDDGYWYCGVCLYTSIPNSLIMRSKDMALFELFLAPEFSVLTTGATFEGSCLCSGDYLYYALRQRTTGVSVHTHLVLAKIQLSDATIADECLIPDTCSRPCLFTDDNDNIILAHNMNNRKRIEFIKVDQKHLCDSKIIMQGTLNTVIYPSIQKYGEYFYVCSTGNSSTCVYVRKFKLAPYGLADVADSFCSLFHIDE